MPDDRGCEFCDEFSGGHRNAFAAWYGSADRTALETDSLKVLPSLGHLVKGYLLVVPKLHRCALADMPPGVINEVEGVKRSVVRQLSRLYGPYFFFEHGARTPESGGCGIYHAHLHALPITADGLLRQLKRQFSGLPVESLRELGTATRNRPYLYCEDRSAGGWVFFPEFLPSQYMRRLIAETLGISNWDWRCSGREEALLATRTEVAGLLSARV